MLESFGPVAIFLVVAVVFPIVPLILSSFIHPKNPNRVKLQPYESGVETIGPTHIQFRTRYYLYALIFVIFDVEVMYLFPWGVAFNSLGLASLIKMVIFIAFLLGALMAYAGYRLRAARLPEAVDDDGPPPTATPPSPGPPSPPSDDAATRVARRSRPVTGSGPFEGQLSFDEPAEYRPPPRR